MNTTDSYEKLTIQHKRAIVEACRDLVRQGQKVPAIKLIRAFTGWDLAKTKDFVEADFNGHVWYEGTEFMFNGLRHRVLAVSQCTKFFWVQAIGEFGNGEPFTLHSTDLPPW